jgi:NitT/TauT family transport system permease protein/sulfonate transport system permease protein
MKSLQKYLGVILILAVWEIGVWLGWINAALMPAPSVVLNTLISSTISGELIWDSLASLQRVVVGFAIAAFLGITVGILMGSHFRFRFYVSPIVEILRPIPPVAFVPISILWFGIGNGPAYFLVSFAAFFPIFTNTVAGVSAINPVHKEAALCLGATRKMLLWDLTIPAVMPYLLAGLKTGLGTAWFVVIVAELVGAQSGLGYLIQISRLTLQSEKVIAGMVVIGVIGFSMNWVMVLIHKRLVHWQDGNSSS